MVTTRAPERPAPYVGVETTNASGYQRALGLGLRHDGAVLAAEHPIYLTYYRVVPPMDFRVALSRYNDKGESLNAVLTRLGYNVSHITEPVRQAKDEAGDVIRPKAVNW